MDNSYKNMKQRPETERPYEKCMKAGPESLSDGELLAVLLRSGVPGKTALDVSCELLNAHNSYKGLPGLFKLDMEALTKIPGIGKVKAIQILCVIELSKRLAATSADKTADFSNPGFVADYYMERLRHLDMERVILVMLDVKLRLIDEYVVADGNTSSAYVDVRKIFAKALKSGASACILLHNHPSGDPEPSEDDIRLTKRIMDAGRIIGIELLDHIVIGDRCYVSLNEEGIIRDYSRC